MEVNQITAPGPLTEAHRCAYVVYGFRKASCAMFCTKCANSIQEGDLRVRKLHFSNASSIGAENQCLCGSEKADFEEVF